VLSWYPRVILFPNFLSTAQAQYFRSLAEGKLQPSELGALNAPFHPSANKLDGKAVSTIEQAQNCWGGGGELQLSELGALNAPFHTSANKLDGKAVSRQSLDGSQRYGIASLLSPSLSPPTGFPCQPPSVNK
jgi:hypothetical protein